MTPKEFVVFIKGFLSACGDAHPTPEQWTTLKNTIGEIKEDQLTAPHKDGNRSGNPYQGGLPEWLKGTGTTQSSLSGDISINNLKK